MDSIKKKYWVDKYEQRRIEMLKVEEKIIKLRNKIALLEMEKRRVGRAYG